MDKASPLADKVSQLTNKVSPLANEPHDFESEQLLTILWVVSKKMSPQKSSLGAYAVLRGSVRAKPWAAKPLGVCPLGFAALGLPLENPL